MATMLAALVVTSAMPALAATRTTPTTAQGAAEAAGSGGVALDGATTATRDPVVTVTLPPPTNGYGRVRLSNDGGTSWLDRAWTTSVSWSLIDPAAGGVDTDGAKTVTVQGGDGLGAWAAIGSASILLDRTGPWLGVPDFSNPERVVTFVDVDATDDGVGLDRIDVSLDGVHWRQLDPNPYSFYVAPVVDLRDGSLGGSWETGSHDVYLRAVDKLGNITEGASPTSLTPTTMRMPDDPPATFEFPLPAVAGQLYTIKPVFDAGYTVPAGQFCQWRLVWGSSKVRLEGGYDATYGEVMFSVSPTGGVCAPWTFTLPYTPPLEYTWSLSINSGPLEVVTYTTSLAGSFRAAPGTTTSRAITSSSLPLYYVLPDRDYVGIDGTVTYRLYATGGASLPTTGTRWWSCFPADNDPASAQTDQKGGSVFVCPVKTSEPWTAFWSRETATRVWRAGYDPIGDRRRPTVSSVRVTPATGSSLTTSVNARITWAGKDRESGLQRFSLQVSRNGGAWKALTLPSRLATSVTKRLAVGSTYRFRVRAKDRAGNVGAWTYSPTVRPRRYDDGTAAATWSSGWSRVAAAGAVGGHLRTTTLGARTVRFAFTGKAVGVLAPRGPGLGFAQVYVDGVLRATIDLQSSVDVPPRVVWTRSWASSAKHTVRIRTLGTIGHPGWSVDAFVVLR